MIYIGLLDVSGIEQAVLSPGALPQFVKEKAERMKCKEEKNLKIGAYLLLSYMYNNICRKGESAPLPDIALTDEGKPYFIDSPVTFNISHSGSIAAVCISPFGGKVGIDVQSEPKNKRMLERAMKRFFEPFKRRLDAEPEKEFEAEERNNGAEFEFLFYSFLGGEIKCIEKEEFAPDLCLTDASREDDMLAKWTVFEALVKMEGSGISGRSDPMTDDSDHNASNSEENEAEESARGACECEETESGAYQAEKAEGNDRVYDGRNDYSCQSAVFTRKKTRYALSICVLPQ